MQQQFCNTSVMRVHTDTVTCCKLIDETTMVTASRDRTVRVCKFTPALKGKPEKVRLGTQVPSHGHAQTVE